MATVNSLVSEREPGSGPGLQVNIRVSGQPHLRGGRGLQRLLWDTPE